MKKHSGFGLVEVIVIVVVVGLLAGIGIVVFRTLTSNRMANASVEDKRAAQATTQAFYAAYTDSQGKGTDILAQYATQNLLTESKRGSRNYSPIVCAQNVAPVSTSAATYENGHFTVPVTLRFSEPLSFTVEVVKQGDSFKIDKVNCPSP